MWQAIKARLADDWRNFYKRWSQWCFAAIAVWETALVVLETTPEAKQAVVEFLALYFNATPHLVTLVLAVAGSIARELKQRPRLQSGPPQSLALRSTPSTQAWPCCQPKWTARRLACNCWPSGCRKAALRLAANLWARRPRLLARLPGSGSLSKAAGAAACCSTTPAGIGCTTCARPAR